ncbi:MAG: phenylalanine--tRNA ligase subunit beta, partial [Parcubacteria group bacterium]|nr:phenylalanine--tRNA ligase subunit beta [Parcubacteria group bacterium]
MKISINWLKDYINIKHKPEKIADSLTMGIAEVEEVISPQKGLENVVVGEMLEIKKHPNADKLSVASVDIGKSKPLQVIFGQMVELKVGNKLSIVVAPAVLSSGLRIKKAKLRGVESEGMCCLNSELGILDNSDNVNFFDQSVKNGTKIVSALGLDDTVLDIDNKSLTHRADLFSHIGIARELSALLNLKLNLPKLKKPKASKDYKVDINVKDKKLCPRYMGIVLNNIE